MPQCSIKSAAPSAERGRPVAARFHGSTAANRRDLRLYSPERLQLAADAAARSGDLQTTVEYANGTRQTIQLWDQFRVWDPGD